MGDLTHLLWCFIQAEAGPAKTGSRDQTNPTGSRVQRQKRAAESLQGGDLHELTILQLPGEDRVCSSFPGDGKL